MKFFATNRSLDRLGRAVADRDNPRKYRHILSKGGYYFVDMDNYMRYYLGTVDRRRIPPKAVVMNSDKCVFESFLSKHQISAIVVCVHGFNVELHEAFTWFRVLTDTMKNIPRLGNRILTSPEDIQKSTNDATAFVGFSWPSDGKVFSYSSDQLDARGSATAFASLLVRLRSTGKRVHLLCHSMGNYLACHTLAALVDEQSEPTAVSELAEAKNDLRALLKRKEREEGTETVERDEWLVGNYVMIAPDVERRHVTKSGDGQVKTDYVGPFYSGLQHLVRRKINIYSRFDSALTVSDYEKTGRKAALAIRDVVTLGLINYRKRNPDLRWEKRLGEAPAPINAAPGFTSVNATELANREIGHSDHIDSTDVVKRIAEELGICA